MEFLLDLVSLLVITTDDSSISEIQSKDSYESGTLTVNGKSTYESCIVKTEIKGRGNSTLGYPK